MSEEPNKDVHVFYREHSLQTQLHRALLDYIKLRELSSDQTVFVSYHVPNELLGMDALPVYPRLFAVEHLDHFFKSPALTEDPENHELIFNLQDPYFPAQLNNFENHVQALRMLDLQPKYHIRGPASATDRTIDWGIPTKEQGGR